MALEAVLFDLDGTLVDSERANVESVVLAVNRWDRACDADDRRFIVGHSWNEIHARLTAKHGFTVAMDVLIAAAVEEKAKLIAGKGITPLPGARALVERLAGRAPLAVVSGASRVEVAEAVEALGVRRFFRFLLAAEDYQRGKPDPQPYQMAMQRLGVAARGALVLEDAEPGILAGRAAGARVIGVRAGNFTGYDLSAADVVVDTLEQVTDELVDGLVR